MKKSCFVLFLMIGLTLVLQADDNPYEVFLGAHYNAMDASAQGGGAAVAVVLNTRVEIGISYEFPLLPIMELGGEASLAFFPYFEDNDGDSETDILMADYQLRAKASFVVTPKWELEGLAGLFYYYPSALGGGEFGAVTLGVRARMDGLYAEVSSVIPPEGTIHPMDSTMELQPFFRVGVGWTL